MAPSRDSLATPLSRLASDRRLCVPALRRVCPFQCICIPATAAHRSHDVRQLRTAVSLLLDPYAQFRVKLRRLTEWLLTEPNRQPRYLRERISRPEALRPRLPTGLPLGMQLIQLRCKSQESAVYDSFSLHFTYSFHISRSGAARGETLLRGFNSPSSWQRRSDHSRDQRNSPP